MPDSLAPLTDAERADLDRRVAAFNASPDDQRAYTPPPDGPVSQEGVPIVETGEGMGAVGPAWTPTRETVRAYWDGSHPRHGEAVEIIGKFYQLGGHLSGPRYDTDYPTAGFGLVRTGNEGDRPLNADAEQREPRGIDGANDAMAMPSSSEEYDVKPARDELNRINADRERRGHETIAWNGDMEGTLRGAAFAAGLGGAQVTCIAGIMAESLHDPVRYAQRTIDDVNGRMKDPAFRQDIAAAQALLKTLPDRERVVEFLETTGLGNDPRVILMLARQAERIQSGEILQRTPRMPGQRGVSYRRMQAGRR